MGLGILDDKHMAMPPGTARLDSMFNKDQLVASGNTKLKTSGDIILIPQPSDDPNDPLNWSQWWKNSVMGILGILVAIVLSQGSMIAPGLPLLAIKYHTDMNTVSMALMGSHQFAAGVGMFVVAAAATIYGKRSFFVIGMAALILTSIWGWLAGNFKSLAAARAIAGLAAAPVETLVTPVVADIFFVHERGSRLAIWHTMIAGGVGLGHVISGFIIKYRGIPATFWVSAICFAVVTPFVYFFVLETAYWRPKEAWDSAEPIEQMVAEIEKEVVAQEAAEVKRRTMISEDSASESERSLDEKLDDNLDEKDVITRKSMIISDSQSTLAPKEYAVVELIDEIEPEEAEKKIAKIPYLRRLHLFSGKHSRDPFFKLLFKPLPLLAFPAVLYSTIVNGFHLASLIGMGLLSINILKDKPYKLDAAQLGLTSIPHLIVAFIFAPMSGLLADWVAKTMARKNKGIFEPEFRLLLMIIAVPISTASFIGFGIVAEEKRSLPWILFFSTLQGVSVPFASQAALTYVLDCHPRDSNPAFVAIHFAKTFFAFAATSSFSKWLAVSGPKSVFNTLAIVNLVVSAFTIPAYIYGKRFRSYIARSKIAQAIEAN